MVECSSTLSERADGGLIIHKSTMIQKNTGKVEDVYKYDKKKVGQTRESNFIVGVRQGHVWRRGHRRAQADWAEESHKVYCTIQNKELGQVFD